MLLTIAIPTFNRAQELESRLKELLPQLTLEVIVQVFDNGSSDETPEIVRNYESQGVKLIRSEFNVGGCRNIIRCIEDPETEWVWLMGDDDKIEKNAVSIVLNAIKDTSANVVQFSWTSRQSEKERYYQSLGDLYGEHNVQELYCISALAYRRSAMTDLFVHLGVSCFTFLPQTVLILKMLEKRQGTLLVHPGRVFTAEGGAKRWSTLEVARGISLLPEFIADLEVRGIASSEVFLDLLWMLAFGLREVDDKPSAREWKMNVRRVWMILKLYGARTVCLGTSVRHPTKKEIKNYILVLICLYSPSLVAKFMGSYLRKKYDVGGLSLLREA